MNVQADPQPLAKQLFNCSNSRPLSRPSLLTTCLSGDVRNLGATKRVPKRVTETVATCKVTVSWPTYWLSDITRYCTKARWSSASGDAVKPSPRSIKQLHAHL